MATTPVGYIARPKMFPLEYVAGSEVGILHEELRHDTQNGNHLRCAILDFQVSTNSKINQNMIKINRRILK